MADSLEDFFARKDRAKKTKGKKVVAAADEPSGRSEELVKEKRKEKEKAAAQPVPAQNEEESEWKEVEYEKDYSGLKIHSMTIRDKEEEIREQKLQEATEQAESKKNDPSGPWKTSSGAPAVDVKQQQQQPHHQVEEVRDEKRPEAEVTQKAKYVPPGMRNQMVSQAANGPLAPARMRSFKAAGKAPEIGNQSEFPSLGAVVPEVEAEQKPVPSVNSWKDSTVRSGVRTENKFDALSEN